MTTAKARKHSILQVKIPGKPDRILVFDTQDLSVGRSSENDLAIDDAEISRRHAVFSRGEGFCVVQDMGTSNGTLVNGEAAQRSRLASGDVVRIGDVEIVYHETTRNPAQLGARAEYASQLKSFGGPAAGASGDATILGLMDTAPGSGGDEDDDDEFEVGPASDFEYDLHGMEAKAKAKPRPAARNLDLELEDLDAGSAGEAAPAARRAAAPARAQVWELEEGAPGAGAGGALSLHVEIEGLSPDLRTVLARVVGKVIELPGLRIRVKDDDLG
jgi:predicted component of type VI protein secretion system